jgi:hypothetical protein
MTSFGAMAVYLFHLEAVVGRLRTLRPSLFLFLLGGAPLLWYFFDGGFLLLGATLSNGRCLLLGDDNRRQHSAVLLHEAGLAASDAATVECSLLSRLI